MAITIKNINELPTGTPIAESPIMFGIGTNIFTFTYSQLLAAAQGDFLTDLSYFKINNYTQVVVQGVQENLNLNVTIPKGQITFIRIVVLDSSGVYSENVYLIPLGEGVYEPLQSAVSFSDLILIEKKPLGIAPSGANTITYTAADLAEINASNPLLDLTDTSKIYFIQLGSTLFRFVGTNGSYGSGGLQMTESDLEQISNFVNQNQPATATPPVSGTFEVALNNFFGTDYSEETTGLTEIAIATGAVLGGNARVKGNWATKPTVTGATEAENSFFVSGEVIYLYFESWSDGIIYWYSKN